jgi:hypothetical protein
MNVKTSHHYSIPLYLPFYLSFSIHNSFKLDILLQALALGHELAEGLFLLLFQHREGVEDVSEVIAGKAVKVGHIGVDLGS